jgi:hypothetical protein
MRGIGFRQGKLAGLKENLYWKLFDFIAGIGLFRRGRENRSSLASPEDHSLHFQHTIRRVPAGVAGTRGEIWEGQPSRFLGGEKAPTSSQGKLA